LAERGWQVTVLEEGNTPASGASGLPVGVVAHIQDHKPSATAEKHYTVRPLALHHVRIDGWFLKRAGLCLMPKPHRENFVWSMPLEQVI
jgi:glycine/D-amino acid oxidase-like deaminating enzyme